MGKNVSALIVYIIIITTILLISKTYLSADENNDQTQYSLKAISDFLDFEDKNNLTNDKENGKNQKLKKQARKKGLAGKRADAYVYGTMRKTGWKPKRHK